MTVNRAYLEQQGFDRWISLLDAERSSYVPHQPGVYAVSYIDERPSSWPLASCGGRYKGRDPKVSITRLESEWIDGTDIVYIGKTDRMLAKRIKELVGFGTGQPVAHWGGRLIWQLPDVHRLMIGWRASALGQATLEENALLTEFTEGHGRLPFANLRF